MSGYIINPNIILKKKNFYIKQERKRHRFALIALIGELLERERMIERHQQIIKKKLNRNTPLSEVKRAN